MVRETRVNIVSCYLEQSVLVSMFCEKRVRVCSAGVRILLTRYGLFVSNRSLNTERNTELCNE